jgi:hypothetical protein
LTKAAPAIALLFCFYWGSDQLKAGEISLIETTPEEAEAAKARLDAQRRKRRECHARKKQ